MLVKTERQAVIKCVLGVGGKKMLCEFVWPEGGIKMP
jgi:hypothetical protein